MTGLFVTGTDTGVGKTVVAAALARGLATRGLRVGVMKPTETGCPLVGGRRMAEDATALQAAARCTTSIEVINPYRWREPIAPALAAEAEGIEIIVDVFKASYRRLAAYHDVVVVEGAGGLLTPVTGDVTMAGVARALGLPVLIVARNCLGAINHTTLTVRAARAEGLDVGGVVLNHTDPHTDLAVRTNAAALQRWAGAPLLGIMPYEADADFDVRAAHAGPIIDALMSAVLC